MSPSWMATASMSSLLELFSPMSLSSKYVLQLPLVD
jgi:hypothetical protein